MKRRDFFERAGLIAAISASAPKLFANAAATREIMIVSGWQSVNIGGIAHTIGLIRVFKRFLPNAKITLWKVKPDPTVEAMISGYFPDVKIITTRIKKDGSLSDNAFADASKRCDFLVHSSGPSLVGKKYIQVWRKHTQKPYGIFGITIEKITPEIRDIIENAAFFFTRETESLKILKAEKIANQNCAFVPDATFSFDVSDTKKAAEFFANSNPKLDDGKFVCVVPRLRYTPYWKGGAHKLLERGNRPTRKNHGGKLGNRPRENTQSYRRYFRKYRLQSSDLPRNDLPVRNVRRTFRSAQK